MSDQARKGPEFIRSHPGASVDGWIFWPESSERRCRWPTSDLVGRLLSGDEPDPDGHATRAVLMAYNHLIAHPAGVESSVQRLRALRRAERSSK